MHKPLTHLPLLRLAALSLLAITSFASEARAVPTAAREWNERTLAAIRINLPNPPAHARNLHHVAVAMYDAWAAYDPTAVGYIYNEKVTPLPSPAAAIEAARHEAISYAAYRVLWTRFVLPPNPSLPVSSTNPAPAGASATLASINAKLNAMGYSVSVAQGGITGLTTRPELGKRIAQAILSWGATDGFSQTTYPQAYNATVNPNMLTARVMSVLGNNGEFPSEANMPLGVGVPLIANREQSYTADTDPNFWQPLALSSSVTQNGIPTPGGIQTFVGVQGLATTPFSLSRTDPLKPWIDPGPPSRLSLPGQPSPTDAAYKAAAMDVLRKSAKLNDPTVLNFSPAAFGNNPPGTDSGTGYPVNPVTGLPYPQNLVTRGDFTRVLAEFWADGPNSETPPGHWHVVANEVSDNPLTVKKIRGTGPTVNDLEWDVKTYFSLSAATHDAACACWAIKRYYNGARPITMIRYMGTMGQSSDPDASSYHEQGLPLEPGVVELITDETAASGGRHAQIWDVYTNGYVPGNSHVGAVVVYSFPGEGRTLPPAQLPPVPATVQNTVRWMFAKDWLPFQRKTFNTPAFPGYVSGHSTFSRAAAETLTLLTGSPYFPGGFHHHLIPANSMQIDLGPSAPVDIQWATYRDAADQAGQSRRWGGIHPGEDDFPGRVIGSQVGPSAFTLAEKFWNGTILRESMVPQIAVLPGGNVRVTWKAIRGMSHKVQKSPDLINWSDATSSVISYTNGAVAGDTSGTFSDASPLPGKEFYRIVRTPVP